MTRGSKVDIEVGCWRTSFVRVVFGVACFVWMAASSVVAQQQPAASPSASPAPQQNQMAADEWGDTFDGTALDATKWERFSFEGAGGGKLEIKGGQLRMRGMSGSRSGVRSKQSFASDRVIFEAKLMRVDTALPTVGEKDAPLGFAVLALMFDGSGRNRVEWVLTSERTFEAWAIVDGQGERLDNRKLGTKEKTPTLAIVRRGDEFLFVLNGQVGLQKVIKNLPRSFRVMLYGFSSTENHWDEVRVVAAK
ncbi:MAG TPA: hypothetical protein VF666_11680 [Pyrinomonadaceae bacterium]